MKETIENQEKYQELTELKEVLVAVNRTTKVVKGGRRFGFAAIVVVGNGKGKVGVGLGKAKEVAEARAKASQEAKRKMIKVNLKDARTIHHDITGHAGAGRVMLRSARPGTGIIAGGPMRAVFETLGVHDIVAKSLGSANPHNMIAATFDALTRLNTPNFIAKKRGKVSSSNSNKVEDKNKDNEKSNE